MWLLHGIAVVLGYLVLSFIIAGVLITVVEHFLEKHYGEDYTKDEGED